MKNLKLLFLLLLSPLVFHAQKSLTGLWIGTLSNDSTTVRKDQSFEIALTQYKEKVYGYSRSTFIINDTLYYILKRVKGTIDGEVCEVKDDEIVSYNFRGKLDKGVKVTTIFRRNLQDSIWHLEGDWKTNKTKKYYSVSGKVDLKEEVDYTKSKIFPHLEELNVDKDVEFYVEAKRKETPVNETRDIATAKKGELKPKTGPGVKTETPKQELAATTNGRTAKKDIAVDASKNETKIQEQGIKQEDPAQTTEEAIASPSLKKSDLPASQVPGQQKKNIDNNASTIVTKQDLPVKINEPITAAETNELKTEFKKADQASITRLEQGKKIIINDDSQPEIKIAPAAAFVEQRKTVMPQVVEFKSDSLELKLYDNGEIDGDTVSILLNGEILLAKQGLKASAIKKTIYIQPGSNEVTLVLYAENLGKYPPNTGLLVVHDGDDMYQLRFSADLQQNAAVIFRRKK